MAHLLVKRILMLSKCTVQQQFKKKDDGNFSKKWMKSHVVCFPKACRFSRLLTGIGRLYVCPSENIAYRAMKCKYSAQILDQLHLFF